MVGFSPANMCVSESQAGIPRQNFFIWIEYFKSDSLCVHLNCCFASCRHSTLLTWCRHLLGDMPPAAVAQEATKLLTSQVITTRSSASIHRGLG